MSSFDQTFESGSLSNSRAYFMRYDLETTQNFLKWFGLSGAINEKSFVQPNYEKPLIPRLYGNEHSFNVLMRYFIDNTRLGLTAKAIALPYIVAREFRANSIQHCEYQTLAQNGLDFLYFGFDIDQKLVLFVGLNANQDPEEYPMENVFDVFTFRLKETTEHGDLLDFKNVSSVERVHSFTPESMVEMNGSEMPSEDFICQIRLGFYAMSTLDHYEKNHDSSVKSALETSSIIKHLDEAYAAKNPFLRYDIEERGLELFEVVEATYQGFLYGALEHYSVARLFMPYLDHIADQLEADSQADSSAANSPSDLVQKRRASKERQVKAQYDMLNLVGQLARSEWAGTLMAYGNLYRHFDRFGANPNFFLQARVILEKEKLEYEPSAAARYEEMAAFDKNDLEYSLESLYQSKYPSGFFRYRPNAKKSSEVWPDWPVSPTESYFE